MELNILRENGLCAALFVAGGRAVGAAGARTDVSAHPRDVTRQHTPGTSRPPSQSQVLFSMKAHYRTLAIDFLCALCTEGLKVVSNCTFKFKNVRKL